MDGEKQEIEDVMLPSLNDGLEILSILTDIVAEYYDHNTCVLTDNLCRY